MSLNADDLALLEKLCRGDQEAMAFVAGWAEWIHGIDDIVDGDRDAAEDVIRTMAGSIMLFSSPFYIRNLGSLYCVAMVAANNYADAVRWETSKVEWQKQWSDFRRHAGRDVIMTVAYIVGGFDHMREMSALQWELCRKQQHQES